MNLYLIRQHVNLGWDTYDGAVVAAETEEAAKKIEPWDEAYEDGSWDEAYEDGSWDVAYEDGSWAHPNHVVVTFIGEAKPGTPTGVLLHSYNAG